jgi:hypothetical protein
MGNYFGITPDEGKKFLHDLISTRVTPRWLYPDADWRPKA